MSTTTIDYQQWLHVLTQASCELVPTTFGFERCDILENSHLLDQNNAIGAFVPLVTHDGTIQIGVMTSPAECEQLARAFLGFDANEEIAEDDTADAFREIANILAGMCKSSMKEHVAITNLGLPIIIKGCEKIFQQNASNLAAMTWGDICCAVIVFQK